MTEQEQKLWIKVFLLKLRTAKKLGWVNVYMNATADANLAVDQLRKANQTFAKK